jgi:hypothetical protein
VVLFLLTSFTELPDYGLTFYNCTLHHCTRDDVKLRTVLKLAVGRRGIKLLHPDNGGSILSLSLSVCLCLLMICFVEDELLDIPYHRLSGCTHTTMVVLYVRGVQHEPLDSHHGFEVGLLCTVHGAEIKALIDDYLAGT